MERKPSAIIEEISFENPISKAIDFETLNINTAQNLEIDLSQNNEAPHAHHWIIETPNGPISHGCCEECGQNRDFKNFLEDYAEENVTRLSDENLYL
jgi:hypothetical protein